MGEDIPGLLGRSIGKKIDIKLRDRKIVKGNLVEFDALMNITLDNAQSIENDKTSDLGRVLLRGNTIISVVVPDE